MNALSPETAARLDALVRSGRFASADEAVAYALDLIERRKDALDAARITLDDLLDDRLSDAVDTDVTLSLAEAKTGLDARLDALSASSRADDVSLSLVDLKARYGTRG